MKVWEGSEAGALCLPTCPKAVACEELVGHVSAELSVKAGPVVGAVPPPGIMELLKGTGCSRKSGRQTKGTGEEHVQAACGRKNLGMQERRDTEYSSTPAAPHTAKLCLQLHAAPHTFSPPHLQRGLCMQPQGLGRPKQVLNGQEV